RRKPASRAWAVGAGALGALTLHFTYGLVPLLVLMSGTVLVVRRRPTLVVPAVVGASIVTASWIAAGFWWWDGFDATRHWHDVGVTGGAGFSGSHVAEQLAAGGHDVVVVDSLDPAAHSEPPSSLSDGVDYRWVDVTDTRAWLDAIDGADAVCHQAAKVGLGVD